MKGRGRFLSMKNSPEVQNRHRSRGAGVTAVWHGQEAGLPSLGCGTPNWSGDALLIARPEFASGCRGEGPVPPATQLVPNLGYIVHKYKGLRTATYLREKVECSG